jgi:serine/threonine protein kinase
MRHCGNASKNCFGPARKQEVSLKTPHLERSGRRMLQLRQALRRTRRRPGKKSATVSAATNCFSKSAKAAAVSSIWPSPYFVMELVRGIKITDFCDENNLSTEERLDLFIKVSQAVQHAHQKGIIHRDLKPSNILVADHDGVPAWLLATCPDSKVRDGQRALGLAKQAVAATNRKNGVYLDTLAAACAETGQFAEAVRIQKEAMILLRAGEENTANAYASRLKLYESSRPFREGD